MELFLNNRLWDRINEGLKRSVTLKSYLPNNDTSSINFYRAILYFINCNSIKNALEMNKNKRINLNLLALKLRVYIYACGKPLI